MQQEDGYGTKNTSRAEEGKEEVRKGYLQSKEDSSTRKDSREKIRYIYFENASGIEKPLYVQNIQTREDLMEAIFNLYPRMNSKKLGFRISPQRIGSVNRIYIENTILEEYEDLYVHLYIQKEN